MYFPSPLGVVFSGALGVGTPRRQIAAKRAGFEEPDPGITPCLPGWLQGVPLLDRVQEAYLAPLCISCVFPTTGFRVCPCVAVFGTHNIMGCSGGPYSLPGDVAALIPVRGFGRAGPVI